MSGGESKVWCYKEQYCLRNWNVRSMNQRKLDVVNQEMARLSINILGISELKWKGMCSIPGLERSPGEEHRQPTPVFSPGERWTEEPAELQSMGLQRVRHGWVTELNWIQELHFGFFVDSRGYSISSKGFLPTVVDIMVIWINLPIPIHLVHGFLRCRSLFLPSSAWPRSIYLDPST